MKKYLSILLFSLLLISCNTTKIGDIDLDFEAVASIEKINTFVGKPVRFSVSAELADNSNNYPILTTISSGEKIQITIDTVAVNDGDKIQHNYKEKALSVQITPLSAGNETITITLQNELVTQTIDIDYECSADLYTGNATLPKKSLIDTKFDFNLLIEEIEKTGTDSIKVYAEVIKGEGTVFNGEKVINISKAEEAGDSEILGKQSLLKIGGNTLSYLSTKEGENIIRFYLKNKYNTINTLEVPVPITLPEWELKNSMDKNFVEVPFNDNYSLTLNLNEKDLFQDNSYIGSYRLLTNTSVDLSINNRICQQGEEFALKAGSNVCLLKAKQEVKGEIEFIIKDKYKQEKKDTIRFSSKIPLKSIEASLDADNKTVHVNQPATFNLTLSEQNYNGLFNVKYEVTSGTGTFKNGLDEKFAKGTHSFYYTPTTGGSHTIKLTITDDNKQTKEIRTTVQANLSPMDVFINMTNIDIIQGQTKEVTLTVSQENYTGKFYLTQANTGVSNDITVNSTPLGSGQQTPIRTGDNKIIVTANSSGKSIYGFVVRDDYQRTETRTLTVNVQSSIKATSQAGGSVSGSGTYNHGQSVTVIATPQTGYTFAGWYENNRKVADAISYTFSADGNRALEARFTIIKYIISTTNQVGGNVSNGGTYNHGQSVTVTATPQTGYTFAGWYEGSTQVSNSPSYTFTAEDNRTLEARFTINGYRIIATSQAGGSVSGDGTYNYGQNVTLRATPQTGYAFAGWYEGSSQVSNSLSYTFTAEKNRTLEARFTINGYKITVTAQNGGKVYGGKVYSHGDNVNLNAETNDGYTFTGWYENGNKVSDNLAYSFIAEQERTLEARFTLNKYIISATSQAGGSVSGDGTYNYGQNVTLRATPQTGYAFAGWYEGSSQVSNSLSYTFTAEKNRTLEARFNVNKYTISATSQSGGNASGSGTYNHGQNVTLTTTVSSGYTFTGWYEGNTQVSTTLSYSFTAEKNRTLEARFSVNRYSITVSSQTGGSVSGSGTYDHGYGLTVQASAQIGYTFTGWYEGNTQISITPAYYFIVGSNRILEARFSINKHNISLSAQTGGSVSGGGTYNYGQNITIVASPNTSDGYIFDGWYENGSQISTSSSYYFSVLGNRSLEARFKAQFRATIGFSTPSDKVYVGSPEQIFEHEYVKKSGTNMIQIEEVYNVDIISNEIIRKENANLWYSLLKFRIIGNGGRVIFKNSDR